jgi:chemotaxis-related protein WspB
MLFLLFQIGPERFALAASQVERILPLVQLRPLPQAPTGIAGIFDYGGIPVPALDLSLLLLGWPSPARMSTRIALVNYPDGRGGQHLLGLIVENATDTVRLQASDFAPSGVSSPATPYLGEVSTTAPRGADGQRLLQKVELEGLLPASVRAALFRPPEAA